MAAHVSTVRGRKKSEDVRAVAGSSKNEEEEEEEVSVCGTATDPSEEVDSYVK